MCLPSTSLPPTHVPPPVAPLPLPYSLKPTASAASTLKKWLLSYKLADPGHSLEQHAYLRVNAMWLYFFWKVVWSPSVDNINEEYQYQYQYQREKSINISSTESDRRRQTIIPISMRMRISISISKTVEYLYQQYTESNRRPRLIISISMRMRDDYQYHED
jgi:hypothetical protein